jgi:hypothetical protein
MDLLPPLGGLDLGRAGAATLRHFALRWLTHRLTALAFFHRIAASLLAGCIVMHDYFFLFFLVVFFLVFFGTLIFILLAPYDLPPLGILNLIG